MLLSDIVSRLGSIQCPLIATNQLPCQPLVYDIQGDMTKNGYKIPKTNAEGLALLWTRTYPTEVARKLTDRGNKISRAATAKWRVVPSNRVNEVAEISGIPREHLLPEIFAPV